MRRASLEKRIHKFRSHPDVDEPRPYTHFAGPGLVRAHDISSGHPSISSA